MPHTHEDELVPTGLYLKGRHSHSQLPVCYSKPKNVGRHIAVVEGTTSKRICFYTNCGVFSNDGNLTPFLEQECQRRPDDNQTRSDWGNVKQ